MAVKKHGVHFDITAENATDRALRAVENNLNAVNKAAAAVGRVLQGAFIATTAISAGKAFATAAMEAEQASKRLDAVLKATGHAAGLTKDELDKMADSLAESTQFDDESLRNAQAQLLKFGNIHGDVFRRALGLSTDLAAFMGTDVTSSVQAVGKALTSPTEGLKALEMQIGKFTPAQKQMIEALVESGAAAKAQALVLDLLKGKIGGAAEALNTGLSKASNDAKKSWDELKESIGKTEPFQKVAKSGLNFIEQSFKDIQNIVENGDWVEKTLAILAFAGGWRGMEITPTQKPNARNSVKGPIVNAPGAMSGQDIDIPGAPMSEKGLKDMQRYFELQEKGKEEQKKKTEERIREDEKAARAMVDVEEESARDTAEAHAFYNKQVLEQEKEQTDARAKMWQQVYETIDREQEEAIEAGKVMLDRLAEDAKEAEKAAAELGYAFTSAFEDAALEGKKFSDVLKGLAKDIGKIILRESITKPLGTSISDAVKSGGITDFFKGLFKAEGGPVMAGEPYIVGERGPELMVPGMSGSIIPTDALRRSGGGAPVINIYPDLRGASAEAVQALHRLVVDTRASIVPMALGAMRQARVRGA